VRYSGIPALDRCFYSDTRTLQLCSLLAFYVNSSESRRCKRRLKPSPLVHSTVKGAARASGSRAPRALLLDPGAAGRREDAAAWALALPARWELPAGPSWEAFGAVEENL